MSKNQGANSGEPVVNSGEPMNQQTRKRPLMEIGGPTTIMCTVVAVDHTNLWYTVCSVCERTLPENPPRACRYCNFNNSFNPSTSGSKRLFRVLMSIATDTEVFVVIMFDRAARVLFGCSADELFDFAKTHPYAAMAAGRALEGEMLTVTLSKPKNGNAQHLRVVSVVPMRSGFQPAVETLRELYQILNSHYGDPWSLAVVPVSETWGSRMYSSTSIVSLTAGSSSAMFTSSSGNKSRCLIIFSTCPRTFYC